MRAYVRSALDDEDLAKARRRYVALGLLEPALDIRELIESLMEEELIGYYDPKRKVLALRDRVASSLASRGVQADDLEWRATVVHELVHALQDQHLGLSAAMEVERTTDRRKRLRLRGGGRRDAGHACLHGRASGGLARGRR